MVRTAPSRWTAWLAGAVVAVLGLLAVSWQVSAFVARRRALRSAGFSDELSPPGPHDTVLVIAPHPDDEVLGCGGLIAQAVRRGAQVHVGIVTNGDASELALIFGEKELPLRPNAFVQLGVKRQQESLRALASLGVPADHIHFLSFPNNGLLALWKADHWLPAATYRSPYTRADRSPYRLSLTPGAPYCGAQVVSDLVRLLGRVRPTLVFVTHPQDVHPDHWVTAACVQFALALLRQKGEAWAQGVRVYGYLIHWPGWPIPRTWQPKLGLVPPSDLLQVDDRPWFSVPLDHDVETAKARALRFYRSQEPSFDRLLLAFVRTNEAFALLGQPACPLHKSVCWIDEVTRLAIGGADVQGTCVRLDNNGSLSVNLVCASRRLPGKGYIAVDVRRWDERGRAVIATAYVKGPGQGYARFMFHDQLSIQPLSPLLLGPGQWSVKLVSLPGRAQLWEGAMATCWGSVGDRRTDPAPWPGSHPDGEETHAPGRYSSSAR